MLVYSHIAALAGGIYLGPIPHGSYLEYGLSRSFPLDWRAYFGVFLFSSLRFALLY